jgi:hypothetical protein
LPQRFRHANEQRNCLRRRASQLFGASAKYVKVREILLIVSLAGRTRTTSSSSEREDDHAPAASCKKKNGGAGAPPFD